MKIFGPLWDAPVCEGKTSVPPPVGEFCMDCGEMIVAGDQGYIMACLQDDRVTFQPQHKECSLLHVIGHAYGYCACTNFNGVSEREAGKIVWDLVQREHG